jgi:type I restriction enzyme S subunit
MIKYATYKSSGVEWLDIIPNDWKVNRLKNITAKSIGGVWGDEPKEDGTDTIVIRVADFDRDKASIIDSEEFTFRSISENHLLDRKLNKNDILLEKSGGGEKQLVGKAVIFDKDFDAVCANFIQKVEIMESFDKRFILHVLTSIYDGRINFPYVNQTTGIQNLDITAFFNHCISYPKKKKEQTAIANYLDEKTSKLDLLISNKKEQIKRLKEIRQIEINIAVTKGLDPNVKLKPSGVEWLGDIPEHWDLKRIKNLSSLSGEKVLDYSDFDFFVALENITSWTGKFIESDNTFEEGGVLFNSNSVLFGKLRPYLAKAYRPHIKGVCVSEILAINCESRLNRDFLFYRLLSDAFIDVINGSTFGAKMPRANWLFISSLKMPLPSLEEQISIANYLDNKTTKIDQLVSNLENQINQLQEIRKIEIYNAVTGKIKVA